MTFEQISPDAVKAENEIVIEKKSCFGRYIKISIKAPTLSIGSIMGILKACGKHLGSEGIPVLEIPPPTPKKEEESDGLASK